LARGSGLPQGFSITKGHVPSAWRRHRDEPGRRRHPPTAGCDDRSLSGRYRGFAGASLERLGALSDGVFAVAMTLLVLDVRVPVEDLTSDRMLWHGILDLWPEFAAYLLSFTLLGTFWIAQHALLGLCTRTVRHLTWLQLGFLFVVTLLPFSARLLAESLDLRLPVAVYWLNIALLGGFLAASCAYIGRAGLVDPQQTPRLRLFRRRVLVAQVLYAAAALTCLIDSRVAVIALILVELYFIVAPRIGPLDRLLLEDDRPG
jgi:uncharacterized membrane protein